MADCLDFFNRYFMGSIQIITGFYFFTGFLQKKVKPMGYFLFAVFGMAMLEVAEAGSGSMAEFLAYVLMLVAGGICVCKADKVSVVLYAVVTVGVMQLSYGIFNSALSILYPLMFSPHQKMAGVVFMILGNAALPVAAFCYSLLGKHFPYQETAKNQHMLMILTPMLMIFLMGAYISSAIYGNTVTTDSIGNISNRNISNANHYWLLVIQLLGMASLFIILFAYKKLLQNFRLSTELSLLEQREHFLNQYVEEARAHNEKTKSFRHDIKNHITVVRALLQNGKSEQALEYLGDMEDMTGELSFSCSTNNPVVDILAGNKLGLARSMGIDVYCSLLLPYPCSVRDIDFCIILSNALDNAIHACKSMAEGAEKYIRVTGRIQGDFILMEIENSFSGKLFPGMGTGLSNIKAAAEKYQGAMNIKTQDGVFILSVLLIIPQH